MFVHRANTVALHIVLLGAMYRPHIPKFVVKTAGMYAVQCCNCVLRYLPADGVQCGILIVSQIK